MRIDNRAWNASPGGRERREREQSAESRGVVLHEDQEYDRRKSRAREEEKQSINLVISLLQGRYTEVKRSRDATQLRAVEQIPGLVRR